MQVEDKANILVVDDNPAKRLAILSVLEDLNQNIVTAESGLEALRLLLSHEYAVILMDVQMPIMDGFETAALIRSRKQSEVTPIIFVTAYARAETDMLQGYSQGAVDYVFTPIIPEILRAKVSVFVDLYLKTQAIKRHEEHLESLVEERTAALRESEARYRNLVEGVDAVVWEADAQTFQFTFVNHQAEVMLGYPPAQWLTESTFWVDHLHPEDRGQAVAFCSAAVAQRKDHQFEYRALAADGRVVWLRDIVRVPVEPDGSVRRLSGLMVDITQRKLAEAALRQLNEELEDKVAVRTAT